MTRIRPLSRKTAIELKGCEVDQVSGGMMGTSAGVGCDAMTQFMCLKGDVWQFDEQKCDD